MTSDAVLHRFLGGFNTGRVLRSVIIGIRGQPFIEAAKSLGASDLRVIFAHILPNVAYLIIVGATTTLSTGRVRPGHPRLRH